MVQNIGILCAHMTKLTSYKPEVSGLQIRAAYGLLGWDRPKFADRTGVSVLTIRRFENGGPGSQLSLQAMLRVLEEAGIEFIPRGVRLKDEPNSDG